MEETKLINKESIIYRIIRFHSLGQKNEWIAFYLILGLLIIVYGQDVADLIKSLLQWALMTLGVDLFIISRIKGAKNESN